MATRMDVVHLVQHTISHPFECIVDISKYVVRNYIMDIPYSHIWTSYIVDKTGLGKTQAPFTASCDKGANWFRRRKRYMLGQAYGGEYIPHSGDYIYFSSTYEQADATDVGIVIGSTNTIAIVARWNYSNGCPQEMIYELRNPNVIGYGIPEYEEDNEIGMPRLATQGYAIAIVSSQTYVHTGPNRNTERIGMLRKGCDVEVLGMSPNGWMQIVWESAPLGYGFVNSTEIPYQLLKDETPYPKYEIIVPKTDVDFKLKFGYNIGKGEIIEDESYLRTGPGLEFAKVQKWPQLVKGNIVDIIDIHKDINNYNWYLIAINGIEGYIEDYCINIIEA